MTLVRTILAAKSEEPSGLNVAGKEEIDITYAADPSWKLSQKREVAGSTVGWSEGFLRC